MSKEEYCPQCPNHCHKSELKCGRGRMYFGLDNNQNDKHIKNEHGFKEPKDELTALLRRCGHYLHHGENIVEEKLYEGLSYEEKQMLKQLLGKMLDSWK